MKTFIIAEAGVNHNGSLTLAKKLIDIAKEAGADAVKFQTFQTEELVSITAPKASYQEKNTPTSQSQYEMLQQLQLSQEAHIELFQYCQNRDILFLSTPFDLPSLHFLHTSLNIPRIKIPSGEITHIPFLFAIGQTQKPVILSTGMSTLGEIEIALGLLALGYLYPDHTTPSSQDGYKTYCSEEGQKILQKNVSLLHCTSEYPAPFHEVNLNVIRTLQTAFGLPVGYSDHTLGIAVSIAAVAMGATIIEKHFTLDKTLPGPDHPASLEPHELISMVKSIREVELALGCHKKFPSESELKNQRIARRSLVAINKINKGDLFTTKNIGCKRPGHGISPVYFWDFLDTLSEHDYEKDELINF